MGVTPVECMGGVVFPRIGELSYLLTLPGHGFYWFQLPAAREDRSTKSQ
jgi:maltose alpha-D-glucosyltransferase/alpha-amylase